MQKRIRRLQQQMHRLYPKLPITQNLQDENEPTDFAEPDLQKLLAELYRQGWDGKTLFKKRIKATAKILSSAPEMQELSGELRGQFSNNIYHFSAAKNYHELRELSEAVYDPNTGQKKSFKQFKAIAENINQQYNKVWLKTEQNLAYGATLMAKKWESFEEEEMLQYKTQGDGAVRDSHRALHNIIKPKNDPFWNSCYPPNGWGCRCNVIPTNSEEETKHTPPITEKVVPQMFRNNSAKQGLIFPEKHPYFTKVPAESKKEVLRQAMEAKKEEEEREKKEEKLENVKELRKDLIKQFKGKSVVNKTFKDKALRSKPIVITATGIKKTISQPHRNPEMKIKILKNILEEIKNAEYAKSADSYKDYHKGRIRYHYLKVERGGEVSYINLLETQATGELRFYSITNKMK